MRSDVKIGLGVGVVLVIVIIAYVVAGGGKNKPATETNETAVAQNDNTATSTPQVESTATAPTTEPVVTIPTTNPASTIAEITPATQPSTSDVSLTGPTTSPSLPVPGSAAASARQGDYDWNNLLTNGKNPPSMSASNGANSVTPAAGATTPAGKYVIKTGDTLGTIAAAQYGSSAKWKQILAANPGLRPTALRVGQTINLPGGSKSTASQTTPTPALSSTVAESGKTYTVQPGDSLQKISQKLYGSTSHAKELYELNKSRIGSSPARLRPKMVLKLPSAPTSKAS